MHAGDFFSDDDDDLPEAILKTSGDPRPGRKRTSSEDDLIDSDIDALIRDLPSEEFNGEGTKHTSNSKRTQSPFTEANNSPRLASPMFSKRSDADAMDHIGPPAKRVRVTAEVDLDIEHGGTFHIEPFVRLRGCRFSASVLIVRIDE